MGTTLSRFAVYTMGTRSWPHFRMGFPRKTFLVRGAAFDIKEVIKMLLDDNVVRTDRSYLDDGPSDRDMLLAPEEHPQEIEEVVASYDQCVFKVGDNQYTLYVTPHDHEERYFIGERIMVIGEIGTMEPLSLMPGVGRKTFEADFGRPARVVAVAGDCACCT